MNNCYLQQVCSFRISSELDVYRCTFEFDRNHRKPFRLLLLPSQLSENSITVTLWIYFEPLTGGVLSQFFYQKMLVLNIMTVSAFLVQKSWNDKKTQFSKIWSTLFQQLAVILFFNYVSQLDIVCLSKKDKYSFLSEFLWETK